MSMLERSENSRVELLFPQYQRIGWTLQLASPPQSSPERRHPPMLANVGPPVYLRHDKQWNTSLLPFAIGAGIAWVLSFATLPLQSDIVYLALGLFIWAPAGALAIWRWAREIPSWKWAREHAFSRRWEWWALVLTAGLICGIAPFLGFLVIAVLLVTRALPGMSPPVIDPRWLTAKEAADKAYQEAMGAWDRRIAEFEAADGQRFADAKIWYPVEFRRPVELICFCGGYPSSWELLLTTLGGSLLGSGKRMAVLNLSRRSPAGGLAWLAGQKGLAVEKITLPGSDSITKLFASLDYPTLTNILTDTLHGRAPETDDARWARQEDRAILRDVSDKLDPSCPVTIGRLRSALRVVIAEEDPPGADSSGLTRAEFDDLRRLYRETIRAHGGVLERIARLERLVRELVILDPAPEPSSSAAGYDRDAMLQILEVTGGLDQLDSELAGEAIFNMVSQSIRRSALRLDALVITGADRLHRHALESLHSDAAHTGTGIILLFEHLRDAAVELLGSGGAVAGFMALGNAREAAEAVTFIGQGHVWRESQVTRTVSDSLTQSAGTGTQTSQSTGSHKTYTGQSFFPVTGQTYTQTFTDSENTGTSYGRSDSTGITMQQVKDVLVEPSVLQGLPATAMIFVEILPEGRRRVTNVDFDPRIADSPKTSPQPLPT